MLRLQCLRLVGHRWLCDDTSCEGPPIWHIARLRINAQAEAETEDTLCQRPVAAFEVSQWAAVRRMTPPWSLFKLQPEEDEGAICIKCLLASPFFSPLGY